MSIPTRIVEPIVSEETTAPTPAHCPQCDLAADEALARAARRSRNPKSEARNPKPLPDPPSDDADTDS